MREGLNVRPVRRIDGHRERRPGVGGGCEGGGAERRPCGTASCGAVVHTDTRWCMGRKLAVLGACRRVLRPGGRMAFYTIFVAPDLPAEARRRARQAGPSSVYSRAEQQALLCPAGFVGTPERDVTDGSMRVHRQLL